MTIKEKGRFLYMFRAYVKNLYLFLCGFVWCFTRVRPGPAWLANDGEPMLFSERYGYTIHYKPGWTPLKFVLLVYWWDYGLACLLGRGVQSLSRAFQLFGESHHWGQTGPLLWGSQDLWQ